MSLVSETEQSETVGGGCRGNNHATFAEYPVRRSRRVVSVALWVIMFIIFLESPASQMNDSCYSMLTAESLIHNLSPDLSSYSIPDFDADLPFETIRGKPRLPTRADQWKVALWLPAWHLLSLGAICRFDESFRCVACNPRSQVRRWRRADNPKEACRRPVSIGRVRVFSDRPPGSRFALEFIDRGRCGAGNAGVEHGLARYVATHLGNHAW